MCVTLNFNVHGNRTRVQNCVKCGNNGVRSGKALLETFLSAYQFFGNLGSFRDSRAAFGKQNVFHVTRPERGSAAKNKCHKKTQHTRIAGSVLFSC